eukprot:12234786-Heterocapsa_arctica.AAC.1
MHEEKIDGMEEDRYGARAEVINRYSPQNVPMEILIYEGQEWLARHMRAEREAEEIHFLMEKFLVRDVNAYVNPEDT